MIRPVILCGGAGTRLWPVSRALFPKQLLPLTGERSLLQQTAERLTGQEFAPAIVVSGEDQRVFINRQLKEVGAPLEAIILEPAARNTSAAATLAAAWLESKGADDLLLLMPSDHVILDREAFLRAVAVGVPHAEAGAIVTFGAQPTEPNTQYGYIEARLDHPSNDGAFPIVRFVEKPDQAKAAEYLATGRYYWNAGIFLLKAGTLLEEMRQFLPRSLETIRTAIANGTRDGVFIRPQPEMFEEAENISIDHGIMEKTARGMVVPVQMDWSDVGSWDAVWKLGKKDADGNVTQGNVIALNSRDTLLRGENGSPLIAAVGLERMAVIATSDAVFVAPLDRVSEVKDVVETLKSQARECVISPSKVTQPWGSYEPIAQDTRFQVRRVVIDPGEGISLPSDPQRSEHWIVVRGSAEVTIGGNVSALNENESTYVPAGAEHRLANLREEPLELIEVQFGSSAGSDGLVTLPDQGGHSSGIIHNEGTKL